MELRSTPRHLFEKGGRKTFSWAAPRRGLPGRPHRRRRGGAFATRKPGRAGWGRAQVESIFIPRGTAVSHLPVHGDKNDLVLPQSPFGDMSRLPPRVLVPGGHRPGPTGAEAETGDGRSPLATIAPLYEGAGLPLWGRRCPVGTVLRRPNRQVRRCHCRAMTEGVPFGRLTGTASFADAQLGSWSWIQKPRLANGEWCPLFLSAARSAVSRQRNGSFSNSQAVLAE